MQDTIPSINDQKITELQNKITWIKNNLGDEKSPLHEIYQNKADLITGWARYLEELQELGAYDKPVNTISTHIKTELRKMNLESAIPYVHEVLEFKYKNDYTDRYQNENAPRGNPRRDSSLNTEEENADYINAVQKTIDLYKLIKTKLQRQNFCSLLDQQILEEHLLVWNSLLEFAFEAWDEKQKVPLTTQHILASCIAADTADFGAGQYIRNVKDLADLTSKQANKILHGFIRDKGQLGDINFRPGILQMYNPKNRDEALHLGFYGQPCPVCGSWRVEWKYKGDKGDFENFCYACGKWHAPKQVKAK